MANLSYKASARTTSSPWRSFNTSLTENEFLRRYILRGESIEFSEDKNIKINETHLELHSEFCLADNEAIEVSRRRAMSHFLFIFIFILLNPV